MGRRNEHSREELRDMAIAAAGDIVANDGLHGLTTRKVAARLGYSPGSLYMVFDGLDDLILNVNAVTLAALTTKLRASIDDVQAPGEQLRALGHAYLDYAIAHRNRWRAVFDHRLTDATDLPQWYEEAIRAVMSLVRRPVAELKHLTGEADISLATTAVWSAVHGVCELSVGRKLDAAGATDPVPVLNAVLDDITHPR